MVFITYFYVFYYMRDHYHLQRSGVSSKLAESVYAYVGLISGPTVDR